MSGIVAEKPAPRHRVLPEKAQGQLHATLRKAESDDAMAEIGGCLGEARRAAGWTLKELAAALDRDERQVQRWMDGKENANIAAVFAVDVLRKPFVIALAKLAARDDSGVIVRTVIEVKNEKVVG